MVKIYLHASMGREPAGFPRSVVYTLGWEENQLDFLDPVDTANTYPCSPCSSDFQDNVL